MAPQVGVVTFPGSLDDHDALRAVRIAGADFVPEDIGCQRVGDQTEDREDEIPGHGEDSEDQESAPGGSSGARPAI